MISKLLRSAFHSWFTQQNRHIAIVQRYINLHGIFIIKFHIAATFAHYVRIASILHYCYFQFKIAIFPQKVKFPKTPAIWVRIWARKELRLCNKLIRVRPIMPGTLKYRFGGGGWHLITEYFYPFFLTCYGHPSIIEDAWRSKEHV